MKNKKLKDTKEYDQKWTIEISGGLLDRNIKDLSDWQKKMLHTQYLKNLRDGLQPKEAIEKALEIVLCFNQW